ncbi:hypothetical protein L226DRAFT_529266 [Lentinus tigrinus ALCF2SS1-7]|uniref:uncharacterized protein n=1 Tax=Lentinus tigrinus ALCF2SS1-7 TaxID=1328758 RepID=UPI001165FC93|nr:hypothetical protein L226DRAFT_529266 [Lentinus tigrinus ALCF2SS1-7]
MIRRFISLERVVGEATTAGLRLTSLPLDDTTEVQQYNAVLDQLGGLEDECQNLEVEVLSLCSMVSSQDGRLSGVLHNLLDIVRGHAENVANAQKLVRCCKENYRVGIGTLTLV